MLLKPSCSNCSLSSSSDVDVYFKASTKKNNKEVIFAPTNLHLQRMSVFNTALQTSKYNSCDDISCGRDAHFCVCSLFNCSNNLTFSLGLYFVCSFVLFDLAASTIAWVRS